MLDPTAEIVSFVVTCVTFYFEGDFIEGGAYLGEGFGYLGVCVTVVGDYV